MASKSAEMSDVGICAAANVHTSSDGKSLVVSRTSKHASADDELIVKTLHISCQSDTYRRSDYKYGGIIIYGRNGETDSYTNNKTHCKSGYVVIKQTDTDEFQKKNNEWHERGKVHGTIYRFAFGESCDDRGVRPVVGEGFGIIRANSRPNQARLIPQKTITTMTMTSCIQFQPNTVVFI